MEIEILNAAEDDLAAGYDFYEQQTPGIGDYFLDGLSSDIASLRLYAGIHPIHFVRYHRALSKRFPFAIYYTVDRGLIRVHASRGLPARSCVDPHASERVKESTRTARARLQIGAGSFGDAISESREMIPPQLHERPLRS